MGLDFVNTRMPLNGPLLDHKEKVGLIKAAILLLKKNEYSVTRRLFAWLFSDSNEGEIDIHDPVIKNTLEIVIEAIKVMFADETSTEEEIGVYIKCVDELLKHQVKLVDYVLERISIDMIVRVIKATKGQDDSPVIAKCKKFFTGYDSSYIDCLWNSILFLFDDATGDQILKKTDFMEILSFCLDHISFLNEDTGPTAILPITSNLINNLNKVNIEETEIKMLNKYLSLAQRFTDKIWEYIQSGEGKYTELYGNVSAEKLALFKQNIEEFHTIYPRIIQRVTETKQFQKEELSLFESATDLVIKTQALMTTKE